MTQLQINEVLTKSVHTILAKNKEQVFQAYKDFNMASRTELTGNNAMESFMNFYLETIKISTATMIHVLSDLELLKIDDEMH